jgi:hypothetical protein
VKKPENSYNTLQAATSVLHHPGIGYVFLEPNLCSVSHQ